MTRRKGMSRSKARARATFMLKTAKQQFHGGARLLEYPSTLGGGTIYTQPNLAPQHAPQNQ